MVSELTSTVRASAGAGRWSIVERWLCALMLALMTSVGVAQDVPIPPLTARVTDAAGALAPADRADLETRLATIEQTTGSQIAVLLVPTTQPEDLAAYGIRVADAWKIGRRNVDDGVIVIVATQDRKLRIEVGRGLEGAIPDAIAKRIISESIAPSFQRGDYHAGLVAGVERIAERIAAEKLPPGSRPKEQRDSGGSFFSAPLLFIIFIVVMMLRGRRRSFYTSRPHRRGFGSGVATGMILDGLIRGMGRGGGGGWGGGGGGGGGWGGGGGGFGGGGASGGW